MTANEFFPCTFYAAAVVAQKKFDHSVTVSFACIDKVSGYMPLADAEYAERCRRKVAESWDAGQFGPLSDWVILPGASVVKLGYTLTGAGR